MIGRAKWVSVFLIFLSFLCPAQEAKIPLPEGAVARLGLGYATCLAYSPDGRRLAVGTSIGVEIRDSKTLELVSFLSGHRGGVCSVAFLPDGKVLASGSADKTIKLWDVATGKELRTLSGHTDWVYSVAFSPDGKTLASGSYDKTIKLWDVATGKELRTISGHTGRVFSVAFSPGGKTLASGSYYAAIKLWDPATGTLIRTLVGHTDSVRSVAFSPDGKTLASGSLDNTIKLWDVATGREIRTLKGHTGRVFSVAFSPDGKLLASGSKDKTIKLWDVATGKELRTLTGHTELVESVAFSPDGKILASGSADNTIKLWDPATGKELRTLAGHTYWVSSVTFSSDGKILASGSDDRTIKLWDVATGKELRTLTGHTGGVRSVAFSPDGKLLASGSWDKTIKLWDVATGKELRTLTGHTRKVYSVAFSPDGKILASGSDDETIKLWDVATGKELRTLAGHTYWVSSVTFSPDGKILASGSGDGTIKLWDVATGREIRTLKGHTGGVRSVAFSPDGKTLASGSWDNTMDNTIKLWDVATGKELRTLTGYTELVESVAFSPDGKILASGSADNTIKLWDPATGKELRTLAGHTYWVSSVTFSSDGKILASGSLDGTVMLWDVQAILYPNQPPIASFSWEAVSPEGTRLLVQPRTGDRIRFDASASHDPDGQIVKYEWDWTSDGTYDLTTTDPVAEYRFPTAGFHKVTLRVTDDKGATATITQTVRIGEKRPPVADFAFTPTSPTILDVVQFTDESRDPDGTVTSWKWEFGDGSTSTDKNPSHRYTQKKTFTVKLTVTDNDGLSSTTTKTLTVVNIPPRADFTFSPTSPSILDTVQFTDMSSDPDGQVVSWKWEFGDGTTSTDRNPSRRYTQKKPLTFTVKLTVTDNDGLTATVTKTLTVRNIPPEALFTFAPKDPYVGAEVTFDATGSQDKDGKIIKYVWDFTGDGRPDREGMKVTWTFPQPGTYPITLTVTDDDGATAPAKDEIRVTLSPEPVEARRVWAVVVGISDYAEIADLRYSRKDAEAFHRWLIETARVPKEQIRILLDSQATLTEVRAGLEWLRRRADRDDLVIFFFAGHGYQGTDFALVDEQDGLDEYFILYDTKQEAIEATALRDEEFGQLLDRLLSQHVLVVFDSCHAGGGEREVRGLPRGARPVGDTLDIWEDFNLEGRIVLAAAKEDQESYEWPELGHGVFTYFLLQGLRGKADANNDGKVTVQELFTYVSREVPRYVREKVGAIQEPQLIGRGTPQVVLSKVNQPPTASFTFSPEAPFPGKVVQFTDISTDDGTITAWNWSFGDGATSTKQHPTHAYTEPGTYTVSLTVTDEGGLTATTTKQLIIGPAGEVTAIDLARNLITISLGSKHGVRVGDQFEVVHLIRLPDGTKIVEVRAIVEVIYVASPDRSACRVLSLRYPIEVGDKLRPSS